MNLIKTLIEVIEELAGAFFIAVSFFKRLLILSAEYTYNCLLVFLKLVVRVHPPFLVSVVGGLMPVWFVALLLWWFDNWQGESFFWMNGEFYIYAAVFATQSAYLFFTHIANESEGNENRKRASYYLFALAVVVVIVSAVLYSASVTSDLAGGPEPDGSALALSSLVLLFMAIASVFGSEALRPVPVNPNESINSDIDDMYNDIKV